MRLEGKVAIVTGAAANIGRATALLLAREGARVVVNTKSNVSGGEAVVSEIRSAGGRAHFVQADVADPTQVDRLYATTLDEFGGVNILVNNAGVARGRDFATATKADWQADFDDNFFNMVLCSQAAARHMSDGDVILNTTSIRGIDHTGREGILPYSTAKAAAISFTKTLAKLLAPRIRVNAVAPGFVITPNYDNTPQAVKEEFIANTQIKRWIQPEEIAEAFLYLATAEAVTGEQLTIDGGFVLK